MPKRRSMCINKQTITKQRPHTVTNDTKLAERQHNTANSKQQTAGRQTRDVLVGGTTGVKVMPRQKRKSGTRMSNAPRKSSSWSSNFKKALCKLNAFVFFCLRLWSTSSSSSSYIDIHRCTNSGSKCRLYASANFSWSAKINYTLIYIYSLLFTICTSYITSTVMLMQIAVLHYAKHKSNETLLFPLEIWKDDHYELSAKKRTTKKYRYFRSEFICFGWF